MPLTFPFAPFGETLKTLNFRQDLPLFPPSRFHFLLPPLIPQLPPDANQTECYGAHHHQ